MCLLYFILFTNWLNMKFTMTILSNFFKTTWLIEIFRHYGELCRMIKILGKVIAYRISNNVIYGIALLFNVTFVCSVDTKETLELLMCLAIEFQWYNFTKGNVWWNRNDKHLKAPSTLWAECSRAQRARKETQMWTGPNSFQQTTSLDPF